MTVTIVEIIFTIIALYLILGVVFAIAFVIKGVNEIDEGAHGSSIGFRIIIIPGVIVFWSVLLKKWMQRKDQNKEDQKPKYSFAIKPLRKDHFRIWQMLAILLPFIIIAAVVVRPEFPKDKLLQPSTAKALPVILKTAVNREDYEIYLRSNADTSELQLEWIDKKTLTYPSATIYKTTKGDTDITNGKLIGRIEARGDYYFQLDSTFRPVNSSNYQLVLYDFIHQKQIDIINF